jgi:hypothetical protein
VSHDRQVPRYRYQREARFRATSGTSTAGYVRTIQAAQRRLAEPPALKAVENLQRAVANAPALRAMENLQRGLAEAPALKAMENLQRAVANARALKAMENLQHNLAEAPALKAMENLQHGLAEAPALRAMENLQHGLAEAPALRAMENLQRGLAEAPPLKAMENLQRAVANAPALKAMQNPQHGLAEAPALKAVDNLQRAVANAPALKAMENLQRRLAEVPALKGIENLERAVANSPALNSIKNLQRGIAGRSLQHLLRTSYASVYEAAVHYVDEHWAEFETENPNHPQPVLFVIASFTVAVGMPLYEAVKIRDDDTVLLEALETVITDSDFIDEIQRAILGAPHLNPIQKRHLVTALNWLRDRQYVDAYPPFYNGLEPAIYTLARAQDVVDSNNRFVRRKGKASKVEDVFDDAIPDMRFKRFLRAWVFGDRGNPFRHGDVSDPAECRRQSLRLAVAVIGWLELFGGWQTSDFASRLEDQAMRRLDSATTTSAA